MPRICAARDLLPPVNSSVFKIWVYSRSASDCCVYSGDRFAGAAIVDAGAEADPGAEEEPAGSTVGCRADSWISDARTRSLRQRMTVRSMVFCSSRTLPGQECD
ncbi:MAG: hypothetical protein RL215_2955 [Planctomycetota bacterium]